jgi:hypothetical protein
VRIKRAMSREPAKSELLENRESDQTRKGESFVKETNKQEI